MRPVVVVSRNEMNRYLDTVVVCPHTSTLHPQWRSRLQVECAGRPAEIAVDRIRAISKRRLKRRVERLTVTDAKHLRRLITEMYIEAFRRIVRVSVETVAVVESLPCPFSEPEAHGQRP